jgi:hydroxymethylbilane synthase
VEIIPITTSGDRLTRGPLANVGGKGLFVKEIEEALLAGRIDCAVHSLKDLPAELPPALTLSTFPPREDPCDVLVSRDGSDLKGLAPGSRVGTSSLRRRVEILSVRQDLQIEPIRGNVETRLKKLYELPLDAVVIAAAGLKRLAIVPDSAHRLSPDEFVPAIGQGILALETRVEDPHTQELLLEIDHPETRCEALAERSFLISIGGSCHTPLAGHAKHEGRALHLTGLVGRLDGKELIKDSVTGPADQPLQLGRMLAERLLARGAGELLRDAR